MNRKKVILKLLSDKYGGLRVCYSQAWFADLDNFFLKIFQLVIILIEM